MPQSSWIAAIFLCAERGAAAGGRLKHRQSAAHPSDLLSGWTVWKDRHQSEPIMSINIKASHKGRLHRALGVPQGQKLTQAQILKAEHSRKPAVRKEADFAAAAHRWHRPGR